MGLEEQLKQIRREIEKLGGPVAASDIRLSFAPP